MRPSQAVLAAPPDGAQLKAAAFAALAEGCILAMPAHLLITQNVDAALPAAPFSFGFLAVFVGGTTLLCRFRSAANATAIAGAVSVLAALSIGGADLNVLIFRVLVAALVTFRAASLGLRDWRDPLHGEIGWGALAMVGEAALGTGASFAEWRIPLTLMIPVFFAASLGSRAVTIWNDPDADRADARQWFARLPVALAVSVAGVLGLAAAASRGGILQRLGSIVAPLVSVSLTMVLFVLQLILRPIVWLISRFQVNTDAWQWVLRNLGRGTQSAPRLEPSHGALGASISRILGFGLLFVLAWALYRALRTLRAHEITASAPIDRAPAVSAPLPQEVVAPTGWGRRSLPADRVRRLYAEALLGLERRGLRKDPSLTPGEFARDVGQTLPDVREHLDPLTRAYEDVRYGSLRVDDVTIRELRAHHRALLATLRRPPDRGEAPAT
jgi:hypothetical protein